MKLNEPRIYPVDPANADEETKGLLDFFEKKQDGRPDNVFATFANHIELFKSFSSLGNHILFNSTLPAREREILILRIGWLCGAEYEWGQHVEMGKKSGLTEEEIRRIAKGAEPGFWSELDFALISAADELHADAFISEDTWEILSRYYDKKQLMDVVFTVGQYNMVSMALNTFGVQLDSRLSGFPE